MVNSTWIKNLSTPIAVVGLGKSGQSALRLLRATGISSSNLITFDDRDPAADFQKPDDLILVCPRTLVVSPGVPLNTPWIQQLIHSGVIITSEISLACSLLTTEKIIGVTGSVGKSTVVSILGQGGKAEDSNCFVGGNLGTPLSDYAFGLIEGKTKASWVVLELSSYQLENCTGLQLDFSAITYLSPNHLERYENLQQYYETKMKITAITKNTCVVNSSSADAVLFSKKALCPIVKVQAKTNLTDSDRSSIQLIGEHNHDNFSVAKKLGQLAAWNDRSIKAMAQFKGLSHRLENVGTFNGVQYVNDSKATAMDSVLVAAQGCCAKLSAGNKIYLLLGGKDKNLPWDQLRVLENLTSLRFIFFGACRDTVKNKTGFAGNLFETLGPALDFCFQNAKAGDIVLLSPGGTSLDEFKNFEIRGQFFKEKVLAFYSLK